MTDYTNKFIYSFEERGLDTLRTSIRDFERMMDEISSKAGGYAGAFQSIAHEISSVGSRARTAAANVDALAQSLRNASATPFSVSLPGGVYGNAMSPVAPSTQITPAPVQPVSTAATPPPPQNTALNVPYQGRNVFPALNPTPPSPTALYPRAGYWDDLGVNWANRMSSPQARALGGQRAFTAGGGVYTVHQGSTLNPEQAMAMSRVNSASSAFGGFDMFGVDSQAKKLGVETTNAARSVDSLTQSTSRSKGVLADFGRTIGHVATGFVAWQMMDSVIRTMEKYLTVQREVNDAMAEYRVATGATAAEATAFIESSFGSSLSAGIPMLDAAGTLSQTRRVGVNDEVAEYAGQLQRVSGLDALSSSRELISLQRQFPTMEMEDILGSLIGAYQKSTFSGFGEIFQTLDVAGPTSRQLGTDLGGFVGLAAGATTVTSLGPNQVEQGIRRISGVYADPDSDFRKTLKEMDVSATNAVGGLRDFVEVFDELAAGAQSGRFSPEEIQALAGDIPNIMGTAFGEMFTAMIEGAENVQAAVESSRDSQDKWADAFTTKMDTVSGAVGQFSAAWDIFLASMEGSGFIKSILSIGTRFSLGAAGQENAGALSGMSLTDIQGLVTRNVKDESVAARINAELETSASRYYRGGESPGFGDYAENQISRSLMNQYGAAKGYQYTAKILEGYPTAEEIIASLAGLPDQAPAGRPSGTTWNPFARWMSGSLPEYDSQRVIQVSNREEADNIIAAYEQRRENLSESFDLSSLETGVFTFVDEFGNAITTAEGEIAILGSAASFAASALNGLAGTPTTLPAGMDPEMFSIMYAQREAQYTAAGVYNPATAKTQPHLLTDEYANVLGLQDRDPNITSAVLQEYNKTQADQRAADAQAESARRKAEADAERAAKEQAQYLKDIRDGISAFGDRLLTPSAVTAVDMYRSTNPNALSGYEDKFDEPIRRLRADIEARMNNQPLKYGDELARAQELGFFPAGIKDVTGSPEKMRSLLEGQLAEYEEAFYNRQLPMESYDWDVAVRQFAKEQQADKNKELFTDTLIGKLQEAKEAGVIEDFVPEDVKRKYMGSNFTNMLFGDKAPEAIAEEVAPYGDAIQETLFKGFQDTTKDADYVGVMITSIRAQVQEEGNQTSIYTAGALVGEFMVSGAGDTFANKLIPYVIAALTTKLTESEPPE